MMAVKTLERKGEEFLREEEGGRRRRKVEENG
jgi:hypothetical protein